MSDSSDDPDTSDSTTRHGNTNLIILGAIIATIIVVGFTVVIVIISKEPGGVLGWLRRKLERRRPSRQRVQAQQLVQPVEAAADEDQGYVDQGPDAPPPVELQPLRPVILTNGGPRSGGVSWPGTHVGWDPYHLARRDEVRGGPAAGDEPTPKPMVGNLTLGSTTAAAAGPSRSGSKSKAGNVAVAPSNVWPGHGVGPGN